MSGSTSEQHHHKHTSEVDEKTDVYREGYQKGQAGGDRLVEEYDGGSRGQGGLSSGHSHGQDSGSGSKGYDSGPVSAPARDTENYSSSGTTGGSTGGNKHYGLDDGYVTRDMSVLGINERGGGQNVGMSSGGGARNDYSSSTGQEYGSGTGTGHQHDSGIQYGGTSELGSGGQTTQEYSRQADLGPAGVGQYSTRGSEYASAGLGGSGTSETGSGGVGSGLNTGGMIEADQVEAVHNAAKPPSKVKQVLGKITHHKAKGPYEAVQTGPGAFTPMSTAIAGGSRPRPDAQHALPHLSHGVPETEQSVGALGHNKTKLKHLEQQP